MKWLMSMTKDSVTRSLFGAVDVASFVVVIIAYVLSLTFLRLISGANF